MARGEAWTQTDELRLEQLAREGKNPDEIGVVLGRSATAVIARFALIVERKIQWARLVNQLKENT